MDRPLALSGFNLSRIAAVASFNSQFPAGSSQTQRREEGATGTDARKETADGKRHTTVRLSRLCSSSEIFKYISDPSTKTTQFAPVGTYTRGRC